MDIRTPAPKAQAAVDAGSPKEPIHIGKDGRQLRITAKVRRAIDLLAEIDQVAAERAEELGLTAKV